MTGNQLEKLQSAAVSRPSVPPAIVLWMPSSEQADWTPKAVPAPLQETISQSLTQYDAFLRPANREELAWLTARVRTLLEHFFVKDMEQHEWEMILGDWLQALARYPIWAVKRAVRSWLESHSTKPAIADIVERCEQYTRYPRWEADCLRRILQVSLARP